MTNNQHCAIAIKSPSIKDSTLIIYHVEPVKGDHGWRDTYQGFYLLEDTITGKQFVVRSLIVSGDYLASDIKEEVYQNSEELLLWVDHDIKSSQKKEAKEFLSALNLSFNTPIYKIKTGWLIQFAQQLLYWSVYFIILIVVFFMLALALSD